MITWFIPAVSLYRDFPDKNILSCGGIRLLFINYKIFYLNELKLYYEVLNSKQHLRGGRRKHSTQTQDEMAAHASIV